MHPTMRSLMVRMAGLVLLGCAPCLLAGVPAANISLTGARASLSHSSDRLWVLDKQGELNTAGTTVLWTVVAVDSAPVPGPLVVNGYMRVTNTGNAPATIGNIVVNLQARSGNSWATKASDIANATQGDDATTANIHKAASSENKATFTENSASGALEFMDATNNTLFSLVPQVTIGSGQTRTLLYSAAFNNNDAALKLAAGTQVRTEVIVTFGNANLSGNSTANVDINGNGTLDADEARVRSVPSRLTLTVPTAVNGNATPTLTDTIDDIATTGTVTFANAQFNLGATSGTVRANVSGGASGGTITNCAHLTTNGQTTNVGGSSFALSDSINLQDCSTIDINGTPTCTSGSPGCGWRPGDLVTYGQVQWGTTGTTAGNLLNNSFGPLYFAAGGVLEVGISGAAGQSIGFTSGPAVVTYLPSAGPAQVLTSDVSNPTTTSSGILGGEVTGLALNVDFSAGGLLGGSVAADFGDLWICSLSGLPNMTVTSFLAIAENTLGGTNTGYTPATVLSFSQQLNGSFQDGTPSTFAQEHLVLGACP